MDMPFELREYIEKEAQTFSRSQLVAAAKSLTDKYKNESGKGIRLVTKPVETAAYAVVRMPATFGAVSAALEYAMSHYEGEINSVLDIGAGTGTASLAASCLFDSVSEYTCIEREQSMLEYGKRITSFAISKGNVRWILKDFSQKKPEEKADLVVASYALNELDEEGRKRVLKELWNSAEKLLLIVEPGTPVGFSQILQAKEMLEKEGGYVVAPCTCDGICSLPKEDWCHFTARVSRSKLHKALKEGDAPYEDEKFSFVAFSKEPVNTAESRVLRHPLIEPGKITMKLCTKEGISTRVVFKKDKESFKKARKVSCGDEF